MAETKSDDVTIVESNERFKSFTWDDKSVLKTTIKSTTYSDKSQKHIVQHELHIVQHELHKYCDAWDLIGDDKLGGVQSLSTDEIISVLLTKPKMVYTPKTCVLMYHCQNIYPVCAILEFNHPSSEDTLEKKVIQMTEQIADLESRVGMYADEIANQIAEKGDLAAKYEALRVENARFKAALRSLGVMN